MEGERPIYQDCLYRGIRLEQGNNFLSAGLLQMDAMDISQTSGKGTGLQEKRFC